MLALIAGLSVFVYKFEREYPFIPATVAATAQPADAPPDISPPTAPRGGAEGIPPRRLFIAHVAFPTVLSSYETVAQLCIKGATSMMLVVQKRLSGPAFYSVFHCFGLFLGVFWGN